MEAGEEGMRLLAGWCRQIGMIFLSGDRRYPY
jgi:hypothetical protein